MKKLITLSIFIALSFPIIIHSKESTTFPRQKILLSGEILPSAPKTLSVKELENFKTPVELKFFDPYNKNIETAFYGFYLSDFIKAYGKPDFKILRVGAIDGYKVDIPKKEIEEAHLFMSYKDKNGYLTVDRMGPARIIAPTKGVVNKDLLLKIGVYWVWQVKTVEFIK